MLICIDAGHYLGTPGKRCLKSIDPNAFLIVCEAHEILGDGFREYKHNDL